MRVFRAFSWRSLVGAISIAAFLAGCGGSPSDDDGDTAAPSGSASGVFTDAPVNGLNYVASPSGVTGVTGDNGTNGGFRYEPGDTITFSLGGLTLGSSEGAASVSPADIASDDPVVAANLLVLLQSLDSDDAEGVIQITLPANTSLAGLSLTQDTATFSAAPTFTSAVTAAGGEVVSLEDAKAHAVSQFWAQVAGTWVVRNDDGTIVFRIDAQGNYLMGETGEGEEEGFPGVEAGSISWDPTTREATTTVTVDSNGDWGLSHPQEDEPLKIAFDGTQLYIGEAADPSGAVYLDRIAGGTNPLQGVWVVAAGADTREELDEIEVVTPAPIIGFTFAFSAQNTMMMLDPIGDTPDEDESEEDVCGGPGIEAAAFTYANNTVTVGAVSHDTNGCGGLIDGTLGGTGKSEMRNITFSADGKTMIADMYTQSGQADGVVKFVRVSH